MKKLLCFLLVLVLIISTGSIAVSSVSDDFVIEDGVLVKYNGTASYIEIPQDVYYIGNNAFEGNSNVETVMLNDGVKFIGDKAFYNCTSLKALGGASDVTSVGAFALEGTPYFDSLKNDYVTLNGVLIKYNGTSSTVSIPADVKSIAPYVFYNNTNITTLAFNSNTYDIGEGAFYGCTALKFVTIPKSVISIGANAFKNTAWLSAKSGQVVVGNGILIAYIGSEENVPIKSSVKRIAPYAFYENQKIKMITMPSSVYMVGMRAFFGCSSLKTVTYSTNLRFIDEEAFAKCSALENIILPNSVEHIGVGAYASCGSAVRAEIGKNVKTLPYGMFANCYSLKSIYIYDGLQSVDDHCFWGCHALLKIRMPSTVTEFSKYAFNYCAPFVYSSDSQYIADYCFMNEIDHHVELGDVNLDGEVNIVDVTTIQMHVSKFITLTGENLACADADYDCSVTILDATFDQMKIARYM